MAYRKDTAWVPNNKRGAKEKEIIQWLDLNHCFVIFNKKGRIVFTINGKPCMIYIKSTNRSISRLLEVELQNYRDYGISAKAIYTVYDMDKLLEEIF